MINTEDDTFTNAVVAQVTYKNYGAWLIQYKTDSKFFAE